MIKRVIHPIEDDCRIVTKFRIFPLVINLYFNNNTKGFEECGWFETVNILQRYNGIKWINCVFVEENKSRIKELNQMLKASKDDKKLALGIIEFSL